METDNLKTKYIFEKKRVKPWKGANYKAKTKGTPSVINRWGNTLSIRTNTKY